MSFPYLAAMIPAGEAGAYTALFYSVRSIGSTLALPLAGGLIAYTESYRTLFFLSGSVTLAALVPLAQARSICRGTGRALWTLRWIGALASLYVVVLASGLLATGTHPRTSTRRSSLAQRPRPRPAPLVRGPPSQGATTSCSGP